MRACFYSLLGFCILISIAGSDPGMFRHPTTKKTALNGIHPLSPYNTSNTNTSNTSTFCDTSSFQITYGGAADNQFRGIKGLAGDQAICVGQTNILHGDNYDAWMQKTDKYGNIIWSKSYGNDQDDYLKKVIQTTDGGYIATGVLQGPDYPTGRAWAIKTNGAGNILWSYMLNVETSVMQQVWEEKDGSILLLATVNVSGGGTKIMIIKTDSQGNRIWGKAYYTSLGNFGMDIRQALDGDILVSGFTHDYGAGSHDAILMKVTNKDGTLLWMKTYGSPQDDVIDCFDEDKNGNLYLSLFWGENEQAGIIKTDKDGNIQWSKLYVFDMGSARGQWLLLTKDGGMLLDVTNSTATEGGGILKLDGNGTPQWAYHYNPNAGTLYSQNGIAELSSGTGYYSSGYTARPTGGNDAFLAKIDNNGKAGDCQITALHVTETDFSPQVGSYTWQTMEDQEGWTPVVVKTNDLSISRTLVCPTCCISSNTYADDSICPGGSYRLPDGTAVSDSGTYVSKFTSYSGCDSLITTHVSFKTTYRDTIYDSICPQENYVLPDGTSVNTSGTYVNSFSSGEGCDSTITTILSLRGPVKDTLIDSICPLETYTLSDGSIVNEPGTYVKRIHPSTGCDIIHTVILLARHPVDTTVVDSLCPGATYTLPDGRTTDTTGTFISLLKTKTGCDSLVTTMLTFKELIRAYYAKYICAGDTIYLPDGRAVGAPGLYQVRIPSTVTCDTLATYLVSEKFQPVLNLGPDTCLIGGQSMILNPGKYDQYEWQDGSSASTYQVRYPGIYWLKVTDQCGEATDSMTVTDDCLPDVFVPNAFTPNHDGMNDYFRILNLHGQKLQEFTIFNRWGQIIFHSRILTGWDGTTQGRPAPMGTYVYLIKLTDLDNKTETLHGTVVLIR